MNINWHRFTRKNWCVYASAAHHPDASEEWFQLNSLYQIW